VCSSSQAQYIRGSRMDLMLLTNINTATGLACQVLRSVNPDPKQIFGNDSRHLNVHQTLAQAS
jgi:hypothetical protein